MGEITVNRTNMTTVLVDYTEDEILTLIRTDISQRLRIMGGVIEESVK